MPEKWKDIDGHEGDAARALNVWPQHISNVLKGRISQTGGWRFEYPKEGVN